MFALEFPLFKSENVVFGLGSARWYAPKSKFDSVRESEPAITEPVREIDTGPVKGALTLTVVDFVRDTDPGSGLKSTPTEQLPAAPRVLPVQGPDTTT